MLRLLVRLWIIILHISSAEDKLSESQESWKHMNKTHLLEQYISICGHDFLCSTESISPELISKMSYKSISKCPACSCGSRCLRDGNCCVDLYLSFPTLVCAKINLQEFRQIYDEKYLLSDDCPVMISEEVRNKCKETNMTVVEKFILPPVTSTGKYRITFKNKFCAECNGYYNYEPWIMNISCLAFADFNYLSSYEEILNLAKDRRCAISYYPLNKNDAIECELDSVPPNYRSDCNSNFMWKSYDSDIEAMCASEYRLLVDLSKPSAISFKNIFCLLCNPSYYDDDVVADCNTTSTWHYYDRSVELSCNQYPLITSTYPFKNIFCLICNQNATISSLYLDCEAGVKGVFIESKNPYVYDISIGRLNVDFLVNSNTYKQAKQLPPKPYLDMYSLYEFKNQVNLTSMFRQVYAYSNASFCDQNWIQSSTSEETNCGCHVQDVKCLSECCYDFAFAYPVSCHSFNTYRSLRLPKESTSFLTVDGCFIKSSPSEFMVFRDLCDNHPDSSDSIFGTLPVLYRDVNTVYLNSYCALCNEFRHKYNLATSIDNLSFFDIRLRCKNYIDFYHQLSLHSVMEISRKLKCDEEYFPPTKYVEQCPVYSLGVQRCNVTGHWLESDSDIQWACEKTENFRFPPYVAKWLRIERDITFKGPDISTFKNDFCALCNPNDAQITDLIETCNVTGQWLNYNPSIKDACETLPPVSALYPYKNYFCLICNGQTYMRYSLVPTRPGVPERTEYDSGEWMYEKRDEIEKLTFRNIFALTSYDNDDNTQVKNRTCHSNQLYDFNLVSMYVC